MRRSSALGTIILLVGAVACGSGSDASRTTTLTDYQLVSAAADTTQAAETARLSMTMRFARAPGGSDVVTMTATGQMDLENGSASITGRIPTPHKTFTLREIVDGDAIYMQFPAKAMRKIAGDKSWVMIDLGVIAQQSGTGNSFLGMPSQQMEPTQLYNFLRGISGDVQEYTAYEVRGVPTRHFHTVVDLKKALEQTPSSSRCAFQASMNQFPKAELPVDVYIDRQDRLRRMSIWMRFPGMSSEATMNMVMDLYDFGAPVDIQRPARADVLDLTWKFASQLSNPCTVNTA